jgi:hypothetical protein
VFYYSMQTQSSLSFIPTTIPPLILPLIFLK